MGAKILVVDDDKAPAAAGDPARSRGIRGDGFIVLERLQAMPQLSMVPVIVVSARDPATNRERALAAGAHRFIQKPFEAEKLLQAVRSSLGA